MKTLHVIVANKIATYSYRGGDIVCGNSDYQIEFTFDDEWAAYSQKTARFIWNDKYVDVTFSGTVCPVPIVANTDKLEVGVYAKDLCTTTSAVITCRRSIRCNSNVECEGMVVIPEGTAPNLCGVEVTPTKDYQNITPEGEYDGFDEVIVNPIPEEYVIPNLISKSITENGTYKASEEVIVGTWVFNDVIDIREPCYWEVTFTHETIGECKAISNYFFKFEDYKKGYFNYIAYNGTGHSIYYGNRWSEQLFRTIRITSAKVNTIHGGDFYTWLKANATKIADVTVDGYSEVIVNVEPALEEITITENGEYTPSGDGYSKVTVAVEAETVEEWDGSGVVIEEISTEEPEEPETESIIGTWVFNVEFPVATDKVSYADRFTYAVDFVNDGVSYTSIMIYYDDDIWLGYEMRYDNHPVFEDGWSSDEYRTITITSEPTDSTFIAWLKANATKQGATSLISFTIDGTEYQAEEGMTWDKWGASAYDKNNAWDGTYFNGKFLCKSDTTTFEMGTDFIVDGQAYKTKSYASGGAG